VNDGCSVKLDWKAPNAGGSPITEYFVEMQGKDQKFHPLEGASCVSPNKKGVVQASNTSCLISIPILYGSPYNLIRDDLVKIRVTAKNSIGSSKPSEINTIGARVT
jgi:hypothetical protein